MASSIWVILLVWSGVWRSTIALESLFASLNKVGGAAKSPQFRGLSSSVRLLEDQLLEAIRDQGTRLASASNSDKRTIATSSSSSIESLIAQLESIPSTPDPAIAPEVYGRWRLLYTTNKDSSSPIQRKAVDSQAFPIYQDIVVDNINNQLVVKQIVQFSDSIQLSVDALASTAAYPLTELTERQSTGKLLGLNLLGVSLVGEEAKPDPSRPNSRIDFVFDEGTFKFNRGAFGLPYPVPFRNPLFRDLVKGWIDITFLSDRVRISRGNKGTTFVLVKEER